VKRSTAGLITIAIGFLAVAGLIAALQSGNDSTAPARQPSSSPSTSLLESSSIAAVVDGEPITRAEWQRLTALDRALNQLAGQPPPDAEATLERLINERLVLRQAGATPSAIGAEQAEERLAALLQAWRVDEPGLSQALASAGLSRADLLDTLQRLIAVETYLNRIAATQDVNTWLSTLRAGARVEVHADLAALASPSEAPVVAPTPLPALPVGIELGQLAPDFALSDLGGTPIRLGDLRGQVVVVNFWATWCPPCRVEAPALQAASQRYAQQGVIFLGVDQREDAATVQQFAAEFGLTYPLLLDTDGAVAAMYQVLGIPTTVFVDAQGVVAARHVGPLTEEQIAQYVDPLLGAGTPPVAESAPDFALPRESGETVRLSDYRGQSAVVLVFYRGST
jgi:peroxiredoxin